WVARQELVASTRDPIDAVIARTGWLRTLGGIDVYLSARARRAGLAPKDLDSASAKLAVQIVPAVRGCIYLVPRKDVPLALRIAAALARPRNERELGKVRVPPKEIATL